MVVVNKIIANPPKGGFFYWHLSARSDKNPNSLFTNNYSFYLGKQKISFFKKKGGGGVVLLF
jgi:hypothetical protein